MGELTGHAQRILAIIENADGWVDRGIIAAELGRARRLNVWDVALLNRLVAMGYIEERTEPEKALPVIKHLYRASSTQPID